MVYPYYAANDYDEWIGKFMADNRKERIENDIPYTAYPKQASPAINL